MTTRVNWILYEPEKIKTEVCQICTGYCIFLKKPKHFRIALIEYYSRILHALSARGSLDHARTIKHEIEEMKKKTGKRL